MIDFRVKEQENASFSFTVIINFPKKEENTISSFCCDREFFNIEQEIVSFSFYSMYCYQ